MVPANDQVSGWLRNRSIFLSDDYRYVLLWTLHTYSFLHTYPQENGITPLFMASQNGHSNKLAIAIIAILPAKDVNVLFFV